MPPIATIVYVVAFLVVVTALYFLREKLLHTGRKNLAMPYEKKEFLLTVPERRFYEGLHAAIPKQHIALPQVSLSSIIQVKSGMSKSENQIYRNKIDRKSIDFVIFKLPYYKPVLAIEYDDSSHQQADRSERDAFVNEVLSQCEIEIIHVKQKKSHDYEKLGEEISAILKTDDAAN